MSKQYSKQNTQMAPQQASNRTQSKIPTTAVVVCSYHALILIASFLVAVFFIGPDSLVDCCSIAKSTCPNIQNSTSCHIFHSQLIFFAFCFGALGSTLSASRVVVLAIRYRNYQPEKIPWQLLTPLHGGMLAVAAIYVVFGGLLSLVHSPNLGEEFGYFVGGFSFVVGFSSELFVKRLIRATEALFGEQESETLDAVRRKPRHKVRQRRVTRR
jgi:hypothetical protein